VTSVVTYLLGELGERLTAVIAGVRSAATVRDWAAGLLIPESAIERRLRVAFEVTRLLRERDSSETVRLWFGGMNPELDDRAPALAIADDPESVVDAAHFYLAHG
jgi:hypothetical protein